MFLLQFLTSRKVNKSELGDEHWLLLVELSHQGSLLAVETAHHQVAKVAVDFSFEKLNLKDRVTSRTLGILGCLKHFSIVESVIKHVFCFSYFSKAVHAQMLNIDSIFAFLDFQATILLILRLMIWKQIHNIVVVDFEQAQLELVVLSDKAILEVIVLVQYLP